VGTLNNWRSYGHGPAYIKFRGAIRYRLVDVEAFEEANLVGGREGGDAA
jgi:hypothetical protein